MQNVSVSDDILYEFNITVASKSKVDAVDWDSNILVSWISVTNDYFKMYIYYPSQAKHTQWVKLRSYDSWGNPIYSNLFYIVAQKDYNQPPSRWGSFGPLKVYAGKARTRVETIKFIANNEMESTFVKTGLTKGIVEVIVKTGMPKTAKENR